MQTLQLNVYSLSFSQKDVKKKTKKIGNVMAFVDQRRLHFSGFPESTRIAAKISSKAGSINMIYFLWSLLMSYFCWMHWICMWYKPRANWEFYFIWNVTLISSFFLYAVKEGKKNVLEQLHKEIQQFANQIWSTVYTRV